MLGDFNFGMEIDSMTPGELRQLAREVGEKGYWDACIAFVQYAEWVEAGNC